MARWNQEQMIKRAYRYRIYPNKERYQRGGENV